MKKLTLLLTVLFIIFNYGCDSFRTPTHPVYPMPFPMTIENQWVYINDTPFNYILTVVGKIEFDGKNGISIQKTINCNNPVIEHLYWVWNDTTQTLEEYNNIFEPVFCLKYSGKTEQEVVFGQYKSILMDNNLLPILNGKQCHTHLNCRWHRLIEIATNDTVDVQTDPQIGFFWRFDSGELVDWQVK